MKFKVTSNLQYKVNDQSTFVFNISASKTASQTVLEEALQITPFILAEESLSNHEISRSLKLVSPSIDVLEIKYSALVNINHQKIPKSELIEVPVIDLPFDIIPFLYPSRYCQSDKLARLAQDKFGKIEHGYDKVFEICQWIKKNVDYVGGSTNSETSAFDTVTQRVGVCRDFAHLGIALCRALTIPARYFSGYAYQLTPPDFHACFEAYLGGRWIIFDPTQLAPVNGLVRIGTGRDATDVSVATIFGNVNYLTMEITNEIQEEDFEAHYTHQLQEFGICL